jgi:hypothetical protein
MPPELENQMIEKWSGTIPSVKYTGSIVDHYPKPDYTYIMLAEGSRVVSLLIIMAGLYLILRSLIKYDTR